ncbi:MAG: cytochrome c oxidase subunit 3 [Leptospiraceae bacterium]|nr:cytochrome c oxidase subunit 3 [Leptospiraceae bacterium]
MIELAFLLAPTPRNNQEPDRSNPEERGLLAMVLLILSLTMLFMSGLVIHVWMKFSFAEVNKVWKPSHFKELITILSVSTATIFLSSITLHISYKKWKAHSRTESFLFSIITLVLGITFISLQVYSWTYLINFELYTGNKNLFSFLFYFLTGLHIFHLLLGILFQIKILVGHIHEPNYKTQLTRLKYQMVYWHFLDIIWILLFLGLYLI